MRPLAVALLALIAASACRPQSEAGPAPQASYRSPLATSLKVEALGDSARFVLQVTNGTGAPVTITFPSGQTYDFQVLDGSRAEWSWSADRSFMQAIRMDTLAPGETRTYAEVFRAPSVLRGRTLTAVARLTSTDHPVQHTAEFRLP
jgi:hypothetical protein